MRQVEEDRWIGGMREDDASYFQSLAIAARIYIINEIEAEFNRFGNESWIPGIAHAIAVARGPV
jgi:hypothetical protein